MKHLSAEQLVDLAEDTVAETLAPHLGACADCWRQLEDLRGMMSAASSVDIPEPSPLFWDQLSARVGDDVRAEGSLGFSWWRPSTWPRFALPAAAGAFAVLILAAVLTPRVMAPVVTTPSMAARPAAAPNEPGDVAVASDDDPMLNLVADLASQMDFETASGVELAVHGGALDEAFDGLSDAERREMQQLLEELQ